MWEKDITTERSALGKASQWEKWWHLWVHEQHRGAGERMWKEEEKRAGELLQGRLLR